MKDRVSITLDRNVLAEVDKRVDGIYIRSRSDAIEKILRENVVDAKTAVILAGGSPEKLILKGSDVYRPLVSIGKKSLIEDIVYKCREAGFSNIVVVGFPAVVSKLYETLGNGNKYGVSIVYIEEDKALGSAKSLERARKYLKTDFLFVPCDHWFDFDLKKLGDFHRMNGGVATLAVHSKTSFDWNTSIVEMDGYKIVSYEEFPKKPKTHLVSMLIGFMKLEALDKIPPGEISWSLQENVFPKLAKEGVLMGYPIAGEWVNVHSRKDADKVVELSKR
ncbi:MAG: NTP transferase domain-containing protein [Candidatus Aenigmarchaeota archaeon]|nr:NTP transferase domain-containing protein [Candidatus Aenigmarchaeota archaeon]